MNAASEVSAWAALLTATLLILGSGLTLIGSLGLLKLKTFYQRVHAPTLGTTLGTACLASASMIVGTALQSRPALHELLLIVFVTLTTPVTLLILVHAAVFRDRFEASLGNVSGSKQIPGGSGPRS
jgi:multicomponent K+:H+ antiporter subunit G